MKAKRYQPLPAERVPSKLESTFLHLWKIIVGERLPAPWPEHKFDSVRKWRFDFAWPHVLLAVELEGGQWIGGRHNTAIGLQGDCEKYNAAQLRGWLVLRYTTSDLEKRPAQVIAEVETAILERSQ